MIGTRESFSNIPGPTVDLLDHQFLQEGWGNGAWGLGHLNFKRHYQMTLRPPKCSFYRIFIYNLTRCGCSSERNNTPLFCSRVPICLTWVGSQISLFQEI